MNEILDTPYLKNQIIPYIGNKRRLLPLILRAFDSIGYIKQDGCKFLDLFSGSGIVSRLAKSLNFIVYSNDWEYYSFIINNTYLTLNASDLGGLFIKWGGIDGILKYLNSLPEPEKANQFIAKYYSPANDLSADYKKERLFYTRYNGLIIDKIRNEIERLYPKDLVKKDKIAEIEKYILLSQLLYQAATHTNTSGVFKAYHKGFGGFSGDALNRILKKIEIGKPVLIDSKYKGKVFMRDANELIKDKIFNKIKFDIVYIDPPYNQHQYGSNYHLLNTIAKWDKEYIVKQLENNQIVKKAGIREDWIKTRSLYCYKESAIDLFTDLLKHVNSRYLLISYNTEGIIPMEQLISIASSVGRIELIGNEYVKYRGGKQSITRANNNFEFILIVDKDKRNRNKDIFAVNFNLMKRKLQLQFKKSYSFKKLKDNFKILDDYKIEFRDSNLSIILGTNNYFRLIQDDLYEIFNKISYDKNSYAILNNLFIALRNSQCENIPEEIDEIIRIIKDNNNDADKDLIGELPRLLKKVAHKKYKNIFYQYIEKLKLLNISQFIFIKTKLQDIERLAEKRFNG